MSLKEKILDVCQDIFSTNNISLIIFDKKKHILFQTISQKQYNILENFKSLFSSDNITFIDNFINSNRETTYYEQEIIFYIKKYENIYYIQIFNHKDWQNTFLQEISNVLSNIKKDFTLITSQYNENNFEKLEDLKKKHIPDLNKLLTKTNNSSIHLCIELLKDGIANSNFYEEEPDIYSILTPSEIKIAKYIYLGKTSRDIAHMLDIANKTVENHRNNIRKKMGLSKKSIRLQSFLSKIIKDENL